jgi:hypothetical protein
MKDMSIMTRVEEKATAERVMRRVLKKVPVGGRTRTASGKAWTSRSPGRLKRSVRTGKSKFKDGGFLVLAGGEIPYYAYWVERGTVFTYQQRYGRKGEQYMRRATMLEKARFIRNMRKRLGV